MTVNRFGAEFELEILANAARDPAYRRKARRVLADHEFADERHTWIWTLLAGLARGDVLTATVVVVAVRRAFDEEKRRLYLEAALGILKHRPQAPARALTELQDYRDYHRVNSAMEQAIALLGKGKVQDAKAKLREAGRSSSGMEYDYTDWFEDFGERQADRMNLRDHPEQRKKVATRFMPTFDRATGGGIEAGELGLIVATTGRGKSMAAANLAFWSAFQGFTTVYISTEMGHLLVSTRIDSKWLGIPYDRLKYFNIDDDEQTMIAAKVERLRPAILGKLRIVDVPVSKASIELVKQVLDDMADDGRTVDLLVLDSADHCSPSERTMNRRDRETAAYWETASIAREYQIPIWTTTHAPKEVVNKIATSENVGESYDKARIADIVLTMNQTKAQAREGIIRAFMAKYRQGRSRYVIDLESKLDQSELIEVASEKADTKADDEDDE